VIWLYPLLIETILPPIGFVRGLHFGSSLRICGLLMNCFLRSRKTKLQLTFNVRPFGIAQCAGRRVVERPNLHVQQTRSSSSDLRSSLARCP
jgi:hypothetical protein